MPSSFAVRASTAKIPYLEDEANPGTDYSMFAAPVLAKQQPAGALDLARKWFHKKMVNLSQKDVVLVAPAGSTPELGSREKKLEQCLRFHPEALRQARRRAVDTGSRSGSSRRRRIVAGWRSCVQGGSRRALVARVCELTHSQTIQYHSGPRCRRATAIVAHRCNAIPASTRSQDRPK